MRSLTKVIFYWVYARHADKIARAVGLSSRSVIHGRAVRLTMLKAVEDRRDAERIELKAATEKLVEERGKFESFHRRVAELVEQLVAQRATSTPSAGQGALRRPSGPRPRPSSRKACAISCERRSGDP